MEKASNNPHKSANGSSKLSSSRKKTTTPSSSHHKIRDHGEPEWRNGTSEDVEEEGSMLSDLSASSQDDKDRLGSFDDHSEDYHRFEKALRRKHTRACKAMSTGDYQSALSEFESILSDLLARYGERHERVGAALHNVAIANLRAGSLDDAMDAIEEAIKIRSRALGRSHPRVADSLVELGIILLSMDEHDDALKVFERALKLRRDELEEAYAQEDIDECHLKVAKVLNNIGCVNFERGHLAEAKVSYDEAISLQMSVFKNMFTMVMGVDANSPGILTMASTMCNRGYIDIEQDKFEDAAKLFEESLQIQRKVLGVDNKLVQSSVENLGYSYASLGQYEKALKYYMEIWEAIKEVKETTLEEKIATVRKVATCLTRLERWTTAFQYLEMLEDLQREHDPESEDIEKTQQLMGEVNYEILRLPSLSDATNRALGCPVCMGPGEMELSLDNWTFEKPENTSKMSGHRVTHA